MKPLSQVNIINKTILWFILFKTNKFVFFFFFFLLSFFFSSCGITGITLYHSFKSRLDAEIIGVSFEVNQLKKKKNVLKKQSSATKMNTENTIFARNTEKKVSDCWWDWQTRKEQGKCAYQQKMDTDCYVSAFIPLEWPSLLSVVWHALEQHPLN